MSRHSTDTHCQGRVVRVIAGYDRPLGEVFLQVVCNAPVPGADSGDMLYTSLAEPDLDWSDVDTLVGKLAELAIDVPHSLIEAVCLDTAFNEGNRILRHFADRPPESV